MELKTFQDIDGMWRFSLTLDTPGGPTTYRGSAPDQYALATLIEESLAAHGIVIYVNYL